MVRVHAALAAVAVGLALVPPPASARKPTGPDAREKAYARCQSRADQVYTRRCREKCLEAGGGHAREQACARKCGKQREMDAFVAECMRRAGYPNPRK